MTIKKLIIFIIFIKYIMVYYSDKEFRFVKFQRSKDISKKYDAILENKKTGRRKTISFGARGYAQYRDDVNLKLYSNVDHNDKQRRDRYEERHKGEGNKNRKYSAGWFSMWYLWRPIGKNPN